MELCVYTDQDSPRLRYVLAVLFDYWYPLPYRISPPPADLNRTSGPTLWYCQTPPPNACGVIIPAGGFLAVRPIARPAPSILATTISAVQTPQSCVYDNDILAQFFFHLSRYEEYLPFTPDQWGRFPASGSWAAQQGLLQRPWVDEWANTLLAELKRCFPALSIKPPGYQFFPTYDIDLAWAFRERSWGRQLPALARDFIKGHWKRIPLRFSVLRGLRRDPYDTYDWLLERHRQCALPAYFFFLVGGRGRHDRGISPNRPAFRQLVQRLLATHPGGLHPSFASNRHPWRLNQERDTLAAIIKAPVARSRQHFLILRFPQTYRALLAAGIRHDFSLGFADDTGFRAGTCRSFPWYDLENECTTELLLTPFQAMDVTLRKYLQLTPAEADQRLQTLADSCRHSGGTFCTLWHNSSLAQFEGWDSWVTVYEALMKRESHPEQEAKSGDE